MLNDLEKSILKIICYFDRFSRPLTLMEIRRLATASISLSALAEILASENLSRLIGCQSGFYFLKERAEIVSIRLSRYASAQQKLKKAERAIKILRFFPFVRAIALYSSLSFFNSRSAGDIDLFIVTAPGRIWSARFFINLFLKIFRLRPTPSNRRDKICVSFLTTADNLNLQLVLDGENDWHYIYSHANFIFLYDEADISNKFFTANVWLKQKMPNWFPPQAGRKLAVRPNLSGLKKIKESVCSLLPEKFYRRFQERILPARFKNLANLDTRVMINDKMIKLHDNDKRRELEADLEQKMNMLIC